MSTHVVVSKREQKARRKALYSGGTPSLRGTLIKIAILGLLDAGAIFLGMLLVAKSAWTMVFLLSVIAIAINFIYLRPGGLPAKYLAPGVVLLLIFQVYVVGFSGYISTTNYGSLHNGSYETALDAILQSAYAPADGSIEYEVKIAEADDKSILLIATDFNAQKTFVGGTNYAKHPFHEVTAADGLTKDEWGGVIGLKGARILTDEEITNRSAEITTAMIPLGPDPAKDGFIKTPDAFMAQTYTYQYFYDAATKTIKRTSDGMVFIADQKVGFFKNQETGELLSEVGWKVNVGFNNFKRIFSDEELRGPLTGIVIWTFAFAILTVLTTFIVGLALALLLNDERVKGIKIYRAMLILPYAFPAFLSAYVWKGMFATENGFINRSILGLDDGNGIHWLTETGPARIAVLLVNLWLGFPYMFLISTGALQAIPSDLSEAAGLDGAGPWKIFRLIKLPLLLVSLAPLLIASFAFNFNNFTIIYLVTGGGPIIDPTLKITAGGTDILITFVYRIAFGGAGGADYGLASAFSILIFAIIGSISFLSFRRTRALEEVTA
jgi:arabinogalactan oligomer/maltooligosaccharide transport system permease protein